MGRFAVGWQLGLRSWSLLLRDRELVWLPALAVVAVGLLALLFGLPALSMSRADDGVGLGAGILLALLLVGANFVATFAAAAVVAGALERLDGGDPTFASALGAARRRTWPIFQWALVSTVVSLLINLIEERLGFLGRIMGWLVDVAWAVATAFALPVIIVEGTGPFASVQRSASIVKARWGAAAGSYAGASIVFLPAYLLLVLVAVLLVAVSPALGIAVGIVGLLVLAVLSAAVSGIARAAMYQYATTGSSPLLDDRLASGAFVPRRSPRSGGFGGGGFTGRGF